MKKNPVPAVYMFPVSWLLILKTKLNSQKTNYNMYFTGRLR